MSPVAWWVAGTIATLLFVVFVAMIVRDNARPFEQERRLAAQLAQSGQPAMARVLALQRQPGGRPFAAPVKLDLGYADAQGHEQRAALRLYVDHELLAGFMPGQTVHVRYDRRHPERIAVDRALTPTEIPAAWRGK
ncbi:DUF3592 domain-containing protein [Bordetella petrii]|nr:DUF3592 domain-containing protein [Bordetella petrii]